MRLRASFGLALLSLCLSLQADELDNPPIPRLVSVESDAGPSAEIRVALVDSGVNYLLPDINRALARDQNGELIGYDFWDMDKYPFDSHPGANGRIQRHGTKTASLIIREAPFVKLVAYRYPRPDMRRMADLISHADKHGVRVIGMPLGGNKREQWDSFEKAAAQHPHILFIASAGNNGRDIDKQAVYPAALDLPNMLVVSSADDFGRLAAGVNWGRVAVDYMVPAEHLAVRRFDGTSGYAAGSSYAVPRMVALVARILRSSPQLSVDDVIAEIRARFANGTAPRQLAQGYLYDPQFSNNSIVEITQTYPFEPKLNRSDSTMKATDSIGNTLTLPMEVFVLDPQWKTTDVMQLLGDAQTILDQCSITFDRVTVNRVTSADYLRDLETGSARTLMDAIRSSGADRKLTVVLARDTRMTTAFDAEAFGRGNTRSRPWLTDSVWLTLALRDRAIALAHELFHVLVNSGDHSSSAGSLMLARTTGTNTRLSTDECQLARQRASQLGLLHSD